MGTLSPGDTNTLETPWSPAVPKPGGLLAFDGKSLGKILRGIDSLFVFKPV